MKWPDLSPSLIATFACKPELDQTLYWDGACPGLGVRVTQAGHKAFIFETKVRRVTPRVQLRITIGDVRSWSIEDARAVARRYKRLSDQGIDPRETIAR